MSTLVVGRGYRVTVGAWTENGKSQQTPWRLTMLDRKKVTVIETGLLLDHDVPAVRVQAKKIYWERLVEVTLTKDQRGELGLETDSDTVYRIAGRVWSNQPGDDLNPDPRRRLWDCGAPKRSNAS